MLFSCVQELDVQPLIDAGLFPSLVIVLYRLISSSILPNEGTQTGSYTVEDSEKVPTQAEDLSLESPESTDVTAGVVAPPSTSLSAESTTDDSVNEDQAELVQNNGADPGEVDVLSSDINENDQKDVGDDHSSLDKANLAKQEDEGCENTCTPSLEEQALPDKDSETSDIKMGGVSMEEKRAMVYILSCLISQKLYTVDYYLRAYPYIHCMT